jgi:hypothetical protein
MKERKEIGKEDVNVRTALTCSFQNIGFVKERAF